MPSNEAAEKSRVIQQRFLATAAYREAGVIALYSSFRGEVRTDLITEKALDDGKCVVMPKIDWGDSSMDFIAISGEEDLVEAKEGFREPVPGNGEVYGVDEINLFVVPGVGYDPKGNRLGMGKGCYDRALVGVNRGKTVALAYDFQLIENVPCYRHDIGVGLIITEKRTVNTLTEKR